MRKLLDKDSFPKSPEYEFGRKSWEVKVNEDFENWNCIRALALMAPLGFTPAAEAGTVWYGNNKGWTASSHTKLWITDGEADGDTAYSKGYAGNGSQVRVNDQDGSSGSSWYITVNTAVERNNTCENWNNRPDPCGGWYENF